MAVEEERRAFGVAPAMAAETVEFWAGAQRGELAVERCRPCGRHLFPPRGYCPGCGGRDLEPAVVTGPAVIYSFTVNWNRWQPDMPVPFALILAEFPAAPGVRILGRMHGDAIAGLAVGQTVDLTFADGPAGRRVPCFEPVGPR